MVALTHLFTFTSVLMAVFVSAAPAQLSRRDFSGQGTFYAPGLGACGVTNTGSDFIVAISAARFDSTGTANPNLNPLCGKRITANFQGKSVTATVVDRCPGCAINDLDFSPAAFDALTDPSLGRIDISWNFI